MVVTDSLFSFYDTLRTTVQSLIPLRSDGGGQKQEHAVDLSKQSVVIPGEERIHAFSLWDGRLESFEEPYLMYNDVTTLYHLLRKGLVHSKNGNCLGFRPDSKSGYSWLSYETVLNRSLNFGRGMRHIGAKVKDFVGIYSKNRVEWVLAEHGMYPFSMTPVPLYDTLGPTACNFIINQAEIATIVVEEEKNLESLLENVPACLKNVICIQQMSAEIIKRAEGQGLKLYPFEQVEKFGEEHRDAYPEQPPKPDDIATLSYTSGTTGNPKGVVITHEIFVSSICNGLKTYRLTDPTIVSKDDVVMSFLPLAHLYERFVEACALMEGGSVGFYSGDVLKILDDIKHLRPTFFPCVPRLLNRVHDKIMAGANESFIKRQLIQRAISAKSREVERGIFRQDSIWDKLVFRKVQEAFGGRIRLVFSAGAPINAEILMFFRCALGCRVLEGYGQTESSGPATMTLPYETTGGHVGPPTLCTAVKLVDVPEMGYFAKDDQGEVCMKAPMNFKGYYKNPEETAKTQDKDGWLHTGDIGTWLPNGTLKIIDRKKNIFKLSQGEYIAPEKIEIIYSRCSYVAQIFVHGDSLESFLVAVAVPNPESFSKTHPGLSVEELCADPKVNALILQDLIKVGKENGLKSFEQVKAIHLHPDLFTLEQGLMTPTMKSKRPELRKFFQKEIERMYNKSLKNGFK